MPIRNLEEWNAQVCRLTLFPTVGQEFNPEEAFEIVAGMPPNETRTERETGQAMFHAAVELGDLQLVEQPDRIHLTLSASQERQRDDPSIPTLGPYPDQVEAFLQMAESLLGSDNNPEAIRLAFGAVLLSPVENLHTGYELLSRYIPSLDIDPQSVSDLDYRINRWRFLQEGDSVIKVNRITKWNVVKSIFTGLQLSPDGIRQRGSSQAFAVRLELDISTDQANEDSFPGDSVYAIFTELVNLGTEIAGEGDVP